MIFGYRKLRTLSTLRKKKKLPLLSVKQIASGKLLKSTGNSALCSDGLQGWDWGRDGREAQEGGDIWIQIADSPPCAAETHSTL